MGLQAKPDSYTTITTELRRAGAKVGVVISGEYTTIDDEGILLAAPSIPQNPSHAKDSGMTFHIDALDTLNELPLTAKLLEQSKGQNSIWQLQPKGPSTRVEKKFKEFLKALAAQKGCSVEALEKQGFNCQTTAKKGIQVNFPNKDMATLFQQLLNENISAFQLLKSSPLRANDECENSTRPSM